MAGSTPRALRVLSIIHSAAFGGPHNQAVQLHGATRSDADLQLTVVMPDEPGDAPVRLRAAGLTVLQMQLLRPRASRSEQRLLGLVLGYPSQIWRLSGLIRSLDIDVVEVHGLLNVDGAVAARLAGRGLVWQLIDTRPPKALRRLMMPLVVLLADVIMTTGEAVASEYPGARLRRGRLRPFVAPAGLNRADVTRPDDVRRRSRERLDVSDDAVLVVSVGNLNPQKGYEGLLNAVASCRGGCPNLALRVRGAVQAGHEAYAELLAEQALALGFPATTVGPFEEGLTMLDLMLAADVFALTSRPQSEGLPTVILEAMVCGVPVVATAVGSVGEVIHNEVSGVLVPPGRPEALVGALERLLADPARRHRLGQAGRQVAEEKASPTAFAGVQMAAYRAATKRHSKDR